MHKNTIVVLILAILVLIAIGFTFFFFGFFGSIFPMGTIFAENCNFANDSFTCYTLRSGQNDKLHNYDFDVTLSKPSIRLVEFWVGQYGNLLSSKAGFRQVNPGTPTGNLRFNIDPNSDAEAYAKDLGLTCGYWNVGQCIMNSDYGEIYCDICLNRDGSEARETCGTNIQNCLHGHKVVNMGSNFRQCWQCWAENVFTVLDSSTIYNGRSCAINLSFIGDEQYTLVGKFIHKDNTAFCSFTESDWLDSLKTMASDFEKSSASDPFNNIAFMKNIQYDYRDTDNDGISDSFDKCPTEGLAQGYTLKLNGCLTNQPLCKTDLDCPAHDYSIDQNCDTRITANENYTFHEECRDGECNRKVFAVDTPTCHWYQTLWGKIKWFFLDLFGGK